MRTVITEIFLWNGSSFFYEVNIGAVLLLDKEIIVQYSERMTNK